MPWRRLLFLVVLALVVILLADNMENRASFSFVFARLDEVPIFMALLVAFIVGALTMLPLTTGRHGPSRSERRTADARRPQPDPNPEPEPEPHRPSPRIDVPQDAPSDAGRPGKKRKPRRRRRDRRQ